MGTNAASVTDSPDMDARIDTQPSATTPLTDTAEMVAAALVANARLQRPVPVFESDPDETGDNDALDGFVADVTTIAQSTDGRKGVYPYDRAGDSVVSLSLGY